ncbi:MAG: cache domain-containing protein [Gemmataceae bacterium]
MNPKQPSQSTKARWIKRVLIATTIVSTLGVVVQGITIYTTIQEADTAAVAIGEDRVTNVLDKLTTILERVEQSTTAFAKDLQTGKVNEKNLLERLVFESERDDFLLGYTVAYPKGKYSPKGNRLYAPYYDSRLDKVVQCEEFYDYTDKTKVADAAWYLTPVENQKAIWVTGYGPAAGTTYAGYSVPVYRENENGNKELVAVVNASISLRQLSDLITTKLVGRLGTAFVVNEDGVLLAHPNEKVLRAGRKWLELLQKQKPSNKAIYELPKRMQKGLSGNFRFRKFGGTLPPQSGWFFYRPIASTKWSLGMAIFQNELYRNETALRRQQIWIGLTVVLTLVLLAAAFLRTDRFDVQGGTIVVIVFIVASIVVIGFIWHLGLKDTVHGIPEDPTQKKISDLSELDQFMEARKAAASEARSSAPTFVPTRVFIRGLEFQSANNFQVSGYIWQTYSKETRKGVALKQGFTFPDLAPDAEAVSIEETFREQRDGKEVVGWKFRATLRLKFDYTQYPFDSQRVVVRMKHVEEDKLIILVPDLLSYRFMNTTAEPGVYNELVLRGWRTQGSYFSYHFTRYDVELGFPGESDITNFPELQFNIQIQRNFLTPFISHIVPIFIVMVLLYGVVVMSSLNEQKQSSSGFNVFGVLGTCGAFFFTIALMHVDFRSKLDVPVVTYLESLYIIAYVMLMAVSVNALLFIATDAVAVIEYRDNVIAKLLYWPVFLGLVLVVTVLTFY